MRRSAAAVGDSGLPLTMGSHSAAARASGWDDVRTVHLPSPSTDDGCDERSEEAVPSLLDR
eukprot:5661572-Prymnesium_polylepis.1